MDASQDLHQSGLARPVLARKGYNLTCTDRKIHFLKSMHTTETLLNPAHF